jgi:hypothetical protein
MPTPGQRRVRHAQRYLHPLPEEYEDGGRTPAISTAHKGMHGCFSRGVAAGLPCGYAVRGRTVSIPGYGEVHVWVRWRSAHRVQDGVVVGAGTWEPADAYVPGLEGYDGAQLDAIREQCGLAGDAPAGPLPPR